MNIRQFISVLGLSAVAFIGAAAQGEVVSEFATDSTKVVTYNDDKYKVETNHFGDNWFITLQGGAQMLFGDHNKQMDFVDRLTPAATVAFGKWFTPTIAVRARFTGWELKGVSGWSGHSLKNPNDNYNNYQGFIVDAVMRDGHIAGKVNQAATKRHGAYDLYDTKMQYLNSSVDVMFDVVNLFGGYKENRVFHLIPYIGIGWAHTFNNPVVMKNGKMTYRNKSNEASINGGLIAACRLNDALWLHLSGDAFYANDRFDGQIGGRWGEGILQAQLGLTYNIPGRGWNRSRTTVVTYNEELLNTLRNRVNELQRANQVLRDELAGQAVVEEAKETIIAGPLLVTFVIDKWELSNKDKVNLGYLAEAMRREPNAKFVIAGYADRGTGSSKRNQFLSEQRSKVVIDFLVNEQGISPDRLIQESNGGVENMFYDDPRCSRAVISRVAK
ncbi:OmpA family protein [Porphyromonas somerae]|uniref:OmpA family protein n=1 Tax=Porphyromonas somerae TaxID=322095 RepID=UPI002A74E750|nr:OmpA family protein [Porphyromonas somerae]MDY3120031.1 OmpA family protein [Porphyromonas somerae]